MKNNAWPHTAYELKLSILKPTTVQTHCRYLVDDENGGHYKGQLEIIGKVSRGINNTKSWM